jgi:hypothetical protein
LCTSLVNTSATGAELGIRTLALPGLHATAAFWGLDLDSELLFVGDAGTTEASRPSRRRSIELTADRLRDAELSLEPGPAAAGRHRQRAHDARVGRLHVLSAPDPPFAPRGGATTNRTPCGPSATAVRVR